MKRLLMVALIGMIGSVSYGSIDNFQELIDSASQQQADAQLRLGSKAQMPTQSRTISKLKESELTIQLVRIPSKKRTMIASGKVRRAR